ncbi:MAG: tRNA pseudouridine(38-40) synthase TruA [Halanaerobiales bacterium]
MQNIKILLEYDGTNFQGWQKQKHTTQTVQQQLENCLKKINKKPVQVVGAGRTDSGVHAEGQVANFFLNIKMPVERIPLALNSILRDDIVCKKAEKVSEDFHARFDAMGKRYRYRILNRSFHSVFTRNYVYTFYKNLNYEAMGKAAHFFQGTHDFSAFQSKGSDVKNTIRTIDYIELKRKNEEIWLVVDGDGFLYNMIRIIVGTLLEVGVGKLIPKKIPKIIKSGSRSQAGFTAPARGLTLVRVYY